VQISIIVARAENGVIGIGNQMPWHLPEDLKFFKRVTMGKPVIMGRKTLESIGRPLPGRANIVISRQRDLALEGVTVVPSLEAALEAARATGADEAMIIGGGQVYAQAMPLAGRLYVTHVHATYDGDARFEMPDLADWRETAREELPAAEGRPACSWVTYERSTANDR